MRLGTRDALTGPVAGQPRGLRNLCWRRHVIGRSRHSTDPSWQWGESPFFPRFADRFAWSTGKAALTAAEGAAQSAGIVRGLVYDSTAQQPLADAAVFWWGTPFRSVTDSLGRFEITGVPSGDYTLYFFHVRLGELGISPGPTRRVCDILPRI